jgi:hypothetical protein
MIIILYFFKVDWVKLKKHTIINHSFELLAYRMSVAIQKVLHAFLCTYNCIAKFSLVKCLSELKNNYLSLEASANSKAFLKFSFPS